MYKRQVLKKIKHFSQEYYNKERINHLYLLEYLLANRKSNLLLEGDIRRIIQFYLKNIDSSETFNCFSDQEVAELKQYLLEVLSFNYIGREPAIDMMDVKGNNICIINGIVTEDPVYNHESHEINFLKFHVETKRLSGNIDIIPVLIDEANIPSSLKKGSIVMVQGSYRSVNEIHEEKNKLLLHVLASNVHVYSKNYHSDINEIVLNGSIGKPPIYRKTPFGKEVCDIHLAVNRGNGKSDYIPCIVWGKEAKRISKLSTGTMVKFFGRIQSRKYQKNINGILENKVAYEVSVTKFTEKRRSS